MIDLFSPGVYLRVPGGNVEDPNRTKQAATWVACNIGGDVGFNPTVWDRVRRQHEEAGIQVFPWLHCRTLDNVRFLATTGKQWGRGAIGLNLEDVQKDFRENGLTLEDVDDALDDAGWTAQLHIATLPWIQNGQGWSVFAGAVFALEIMADEQTNTFPGGQPDPVVIDQCIQHAFDEGCEKVTLMLKTKGFDAGDYGRHFNVCHSLYTGDDITPTVEAWKLWAQAQPCTRLIEEEPVPPPPENPYPYDKSYPRAAKAPVGPDKLPRPLYPPDAEAKGKEPSPPGPDVLAYKRAMKRAQQGAKDKEFSQLDDAYTNKFAHGTDATWPGGIEGFQDCQGIDSTGWIGDKTYQAMRYAAVPYGPNQGQPLFDQKCVDLLVQAEIEFNTGSNEEKVRKFIAEFLTIAEANEENWHYSQNRPIDVSVDPDANSVTSDCSGYAIQAYHYALRESGLPVADPAKQGFSGFGNTSTFEDDHPKVTNGAFKVGDLAHYNGHVTVCKVAGNATTAWFSSHGQEAGPDPVRLHYRSDLRFVVRPPLLEDV